jgi:hypothetical protein
MFQVFIKEIYIYIYIKEKRKKTYLLFFLHNPNFKGFLKGGLLEFTQNVFVNVFSFAVFVKD